MQNKIKSKLKKLLILSKRGDTNEKELAYKFLNKLLKKYNIKIEDIENQEKFLFKFYFVSKYEKQLLINITFKVLNTDKLSYNQKGKNIFLNITKKEYCQIEYLFQIYRKELKKELDITLKGFIISNKIFNNQERKSKYDK